MNKKRNLAVVMAAATVATSVAPVFAAEAKSLDGETVSAKDKATMDKLREEIQDYLAKKYVNEKKSLLDEDLANKNVYKITLDYTIDGKKDDTEVTKIKDYDKKISELKSVDDEIAITIEDNGHKLVDGKYYDCEIETYTNKEATALASDKVAIDQIKGLEYNLDKDKIVTETDPDEEKDDKKISIVENVTDGKDYLNVKLVNNKEYLKIKKDSVKTIILTEAGKINKGDLKPIFKEGTGGEKLDKDGIYTTDPSKYVILGFEAHKEALDDKDIESDIEITIVNDNVAKTVESSDLYDTDLEKLTKEGNDIANFISEYTLADRKSDKVNGELKSHTLELKVNVDKDGVETKFSKLTIKGTTEDLEILAGVFAKKGAEITGAVNTNQPSIKTIAGDDRESTAIEISKEAFEENTAKNIVLVSGYAIADGLSATPFATSKEAPILLTGKDKISTKVMDEIERAMVKGGKVYLVGGTSSLSKDIEKQLDNKYIKFERISGSDRMATSLKVAKEIAKDNVLNDLFVAGGYAEADAMSVAGVAASGSEIGELSAGVDPILLTDKKGLTDDQKDWLNRQDDINSAYIAGGKNSVPTEVSKALEEVAADVYRLAGDDRQSTNAEVLSEFYKDETIENLYVAKSDNNGLVDALPAGVLASIDDKKGPIVLATKELNKDQKSVMNAFKVKAGSMGKGKRVQIGNGIADKVWEFLNDVE